MFFTTLALFLKSPFGQKLSLDATLVGKGTQDRRPLLHVEGLALTDLRPGGHARMDGQRVDVVAQTGYIHSGCRIRVIKVAGNQITVIQVAPNVTKIKSTS